MHARSASYIVDRSDVLAGPFTITDL